MNPRVLTALLLLTVASTELPAQSEPLWRTVDISRQLRDTASQRIRVHYGAGKVDVRGAADPLLYSMHLRYDERRARPLHHHDAAQRVTTLGLEPRDASIRSSGRRDSPELRLTLPRTLALDLDLQFGGTQSVLDLGGMSVQSLRLECGAADASLLFSRPNRLMMRDLDVQVGAADFSAGQLANANAEQIRVSGGVGSVNLDFGGTWTRDLTVTSRLMLGKLTLQIPANVGVRVELHRIVAGFDHTGLIKRDDAWYSANFETAQFKLRVKAETLFGQIEIQHSSP